MNAGLCRRSCKVLAMVLLLAMTAAGAMAEHPQTQPATEPAATQPTTQPAIPVVYANNEGKPFPKIPPKEVARIIARAGEMTPPGRDIWFVLIRSGAWFPAAEVYCTPQKVDGRLCSGQYAIIWQQDAEKPITKLYGKTQWEDYVAVVEPNTPAPKVGLGQAPPVPKTSWLPFARPSLDDKLIVPLIDTVQAYRPRDKDFEHPHPSMPISEIEHEGNDGGKYNVVVAWPDQGCEDFCMVKRTDKGFEAVGWSFQVH